MVFSRGGNNSVALAVLLPGYASVINSKLKVLMGCISINECDLQGTLYHRYGVKHLRVFKVFTQSNKVSSAAATDHPSYLYMVYIQ